MKAVYIDVQNIHRKTKDYGRIVDRKKLYVYLQQKYKIDVVYFAVGYVSRYQKFYKTIQNIGYTMLYKETIVLPNNTIKGNVDIDIAIKVLLDLWKQGLSQAYIMTNDGDYNTLIQTLIDERVFGGLIVGDRKTASTLIKKFNKTILDLQDIKQKIFKV